MLCLLGGEQQSQDVGAADSIPRPDNLPQALILSPGPEHFLPSLLSGVYACPEMWDSHCYIDTQVVPVDTQQIDCTSDT